jgi:NAD(P)H-quinone oxidoreductase subunit 5
MIILNPLLGLFINLLFFKKNLPMGSRIASLGIWIGFINALIAWCISLPFSEKNESWGFIANEVSWLMAILILFVSAIVHQFSLRYMAGDRCYRRYFLFLSLITVSTLLMVASDNLVFLITFWSLSNLMLALLMVHKFEWAAAKNSGILTIKTFVLGLVFLIAGTGLLAYESGTLSLRLITENSESLSASIRMIALFFIILAAFTQSGGWPFHGWLVSSLNSPTPVSAFMHAGLVNGGGLLLARFAPVFFHERLLLNILFMLAVITLILGGIWKLLQSNIKLMLAYSTMTQMGFMMMQCALGLFPAALAHLCWHGLFKAFLFLRSGSTIAEHRRTHEERVNTVSTFFLSSFCGVIGAIGFIIGSGLSFTLVDTTAVLILFSWMASTQVSHTLLQKEKSPLFVLTASVFCLATGILYGLTVDLIEVAVAPLQIWQPQVLNSIHIIAITLIFCIWIALNLNSFTDREGSLWWRRFYVRMLNASQPDPKTITSSRNGYKF